MIQKSKWAKGEPTQTSAGTTGFLPPFKTCLIIYMGEECERLGLDLGKEIDRVGYIIARLYPDRPPGPVGFNDHPATSYDDVAKIVTTWEIER